MDMDPGELREKRLGAAEDNHKATGEGRVNGKESKAGLITAVLALLIGIGVVVFLYQLNTTMAARNAELDSQFANVGVMLDALAERLEQDRQFMKAVSSDVELVRKRLGITQGELKQARALAEQVQKEQQKNVIQLTSQLQTKADSNQVESLDERTDTRFTEVGDKIDGVEAEIAASRREIEKTWQELNSLGIQVTEQGKLIATNATGVEELRKRGERDYLTFDARKKVRISVGDVTLELRKADRKKQRADLKLYYDDREVEKKKIYTNTPVLFYVGRDRVQHELVINEVRKDQIVGYISVPLGKVATTPRLTGAGN